MTPISINEAIIVTPSGRLDCVLALPPFDINIPFTESLLKNTRKNTGMTMRKSEQNIIGMVIFGGADGAVSVALMYFGIIRSDSVVTRPPAHASPDNTKSEYLAQFFLNKIPTPIAIEGMAPAKVIIVSGSMAGRALAASGSA